MEREESNDLVESLPSARGLSRRCLFLRNSLVVLEKAALPGKKKMIKLRYQKALLHILFQGLQLIRGK